MLTLQLLNPWALTLLVLLPLAGWIASRGGVHMPRDRAWFSLALRLLVLALLVLALAMPRVLRTANRLSTVFLVDVSNSITPDQVNAELGWIRSALAAQGPRDQAGVVLFGANAVVEQPLSHLTSLPRFASTVEQGHTDIAAAVRLGLGLLPNTTARRLVLLSDGNENLEQSLDQARIAGAAGVQLDVVPIAKNQTPEVYVKQVVAPDSLREGETFALTVTVVSNVVTRAELRLLTDGQVSSQEAVQIHSGTNSFVFNHQPLPGGPHVFQAIVQPGEDTVSQNNQASAFTNVAGKPKVLIIDGDPGDSTALAAALRSQGTQVDLSTPSGLPADLPTLRAYDTVVLSNVPADRLTPAQMQNLQTYVRDLGGGLLVVGGNKSYGTGNYHNTPLETVLPVTSEVAPREDLPSTAVFFIIESLENNLGIDISREAAKAAINALSPLDQVGVSDGTQPWAIPVQQVNNKAALLSKIDGLQMGDPSSYAPFFDAARQQLLASNAKVKHIILLGDGDASDSYQSQIEAIAAEHITVSVVGTNVLPQDLQLLQNIAQWGQGRYYDGNDPFNIPRLLLQETQLVARPAIVEQTFQPLPAASSPILSGIGASHLPPLKGYVATTPKPTAQVILASNQGDPVLAEWQYGLGRAAAWTSDTKGQWAADWVTWPNFAQFWSQVVKSTLPGQIEQNLQTTISPSAGGASATVTVDSQNANRELQNFLGTTAVVFDPAGTRQEVTLNQVAPGEYQGQFPDSAQGVYLVEIVQRNSRQQVVGAETKGYVVPYSPEYDVVDTNVNLLQQLAAATGGSVLASAADAFAHTLAAPGGATPIWPELAAAALLLFLLDVASRRLRISPAGLLGLVQRFQRRPPAARPAANRVAPSRISQPANFGEAFPAASRSAGPATEPEPAIPAGPAATQPESQDAVRGRLFEAKRRAQAQRRSP